VGGPIFGPASLRRAELRQALEQAPPNMTYAGQVPRRSVYGYLHAADVFVSLARQETFGIAALEAAAAGRPLVPDADYVPDRSRRSASQATACG
jgi:glycosyltransferase involved in cell wall biosynthesis